MILLVGLGNPGKQYENTRHNVGFMILDKLAETLNVSFSKDNNLHAQVAETNISGEKVVLLKPETFMNRSGESIKLAMQRFSLTDVSNIWVAYDDVDLPFGTLRIRLDGSSGGHNGIKSTIEYVGQDDFVRFRFGISEPAPPILLEDWVLTSFSKEQTTDLERMITESVTKIMQAIEHGIAQVTEKLA